MQSYTFQESFSHACNYTNFVITVSYLFTTALMRSLLYMAESQVFTLFTFECPA